MNVSEFLLHPLHLSNTDKLVGVTRQGRELRENRIAGSLIL